MGHLLEMLSRPEMFVAALIGVCVLVGMTLRAFTTIVTSFSRERTRREVAAYIAEASMTPEQGERLLRADLRRAG